MKKTNTALVAIIGFGFFIVVLIIIGVFTASKFTQQLQPQINEATSIARSIANANGGTANAIANTVNNATAPTTIPGQGSTGNVNNANIPVGAAIIDIGDGSNFGSVERFRLGTNGTTVITGTPLANVGAVPIALGGGVGHKIIVVNKALPSPLSGNIRLFGVAAREGGTLREVVINQPNSTPPGFVTTYTATEADVYTPNIPTRF